MQAAVGYLRVSTQEQGETQRHCMGLRICRSVVESHGGRMWTAGTLVMAQLFTLACLPRLPTLHNRIYGGCRIRMSVST
jgi:signal transduction histidine kinase